MKIVSFEEIKSWQLAQDLAVEIYQTFAGHKDFSFSDQIKRAAVSISNNIAEGFERGSDADFVRNAIYYRRFCGRGKIYDISSRTTEFRLARIKGSFVRSNEHYFKTHHRPH